MESRPRVEWLQAVWNLMQAQSKALAERETEAFLELTDQLQGLCAVPPAPLDSPPDPVERAWLDNLARMNRSLAQQLLALGEPLRELEALARQSDLAVALDCCA